jgi:hypothetical protein
MRSQQIRDLVLDLLWSQWRSLGVPAAVERSLLLIDLEALVIETASRTNDGESRIRDGAISWLVEYPQLVTTVRLRGFMRQVDPAVAHATSVLARQVADNGVRVSWAMADEAPRWKPGIDVKLPSLPERPELLRLRTRALFGANARAEVAALLATHESPIAIPVVVARTGYSRRQVVEALGGLEMGGWVTRTMVASSSRFALAGTARATLGFAVRDLQLGPGAHDLIRQSTAPTWLDWFDRFALLRLLERAAVQLEAGDPIAALLAIRTADDAFRSQGIPIPDATGSHESSDELMQRIGEWTGGCARRLAGLAIVL